MVEKQFESAVDRLRAPEMVGRVDTLRLVLYRRSG